MIRIKITKSHKRYKIGDTVFVSRNEAHDLIDGGFGVQTKDMTALDYKTTKKVKKRG